MADKNTIGIPPKVEMPKTEKREVRVERPEVIRPQIQVEKGIPAEEKPSAVPSKKAAPPAQPVRRRVEKSELRKKIEGILEEDLEEVYRSLPPQARTKFRVDGEKTARRIEVALKIAKTALTDLIKIIREWLIALPGVNRFFVEQEAKIKADKLIHLRKNEE